MPRKINKRKKVQTEKRRAAATNQKPRQRIGVIAHGPTSGLALAMTLARAIATKGTSHDRT